MAITARGAWESVRRHAGVLGKDVDAAYLENMQEMDRPESLDELRELGQAVAMQVQPEHLPAAFDKGVRMVQC